MKERDTLYIPMGLKEENELWDGFGKEEGKKALIFTGFALTMDILIYLLRRNIIVCMVFMMTAIGGSLIMLTKDTTNLSAVDQIKNMIRFSMSQKYYPYRQLDEWK